MSIAALTSERRPAITAQTWAMSKRAILALARQPTVVFPSLVFPLFFVALGTAAFGRAIELPNFPEVDSFLDFALAGAILQGVLFGSVTSATALATDIETGFFDRLMASPASRASILVGRLAGAMAYAALQTIVFIAVLIPFGLTLRAGPLGVLVMVVGGMLTALAVGGLMSAMAIRTGSSEAVQGAFPLLFILLFLSSAFFPRETMNGAYRRVADFNPISHLVEGFRDLTIDGLSWSAVGRTLLVSGGLAVLAMALALRSLRKRVAAR
ncbi:MAG TPA: ABC transporter permease [Ilumatobacteraceae bacterium]|nr:ABC transporter permease [Ilumatobacteraceae bacterium]